MDQLVKDPDAVLDYSYDWAEWLADGETITSSTWTVPDGLTEDRDPTHTETTTTVWVSGGQPWARYALTNHIVTSQGRTDDRSTLHLLVRDR